MRRTYRAFTLTALGLATLLLSACGGADSAAFRALRARECAIYFSIDAYLKESGRGSSPSITRGCPPQYNNIADFSAVDEAAQPRGGTAENLHGEMLKRGVPADVAAIVRRSHAFRDWVKLAQAAR